MSECCICFCDLPVDSKQYVRELCNDCVPLLKETNERGDIIHPSSRKPLATCMCGKLWNADCRSKSSLSPVDTSKLRQNDPIFNMAYATNPANLVLVKSKHALITGRRK